MNERGQSERNIPALALGSGMMNQFSLIIYHPVGDSARFTSHRCSFRRRTAWERLDISTIHSPEHKGYQIGKRYDFVSYKLKLTWRTSSEPVSGHAPRAFVPTIKDAARLRNVRPVNHLPRPPATSFIVHHSEPIRKMLFCHRTQSIRPPWLPSDHRNQRRRGTTNPSGCRHNTEKPDLTRRQVDPRNKRLFLAPRSRSLSLVPHKTAYWADFVINFAKIMRKTDGLYIIYGTQTTQE